MRLFVAVDPSEGTRRELAACVDLGRAIARGARWVRAESLHLTLCFLGHVEDNAVEGVSEAVTHAARRHPPLSFTVDAIDTFGPRRRPRVLWFGVSSGRAALIALQADLAHELELLGFAAEERAFTPHLTLARAGTRDGDGDLAAVRDELTGREIGPSSVNEVTLYRSETTHGGAIYSALARVPLVG